jgi:hypothetical protein
MSACGVSDEEAFETNILSLFYSCALALLALDLRVPVTRIADIVGERRGIPQTPLPSPAPTNFGFVGGLPHMRAVARDAVTARCHFCGRNYTS